MSLLARSTRGITLAHVRHVTPVPPGRATGTVARVYHDMEREFGMLAPPIALHAPAPDALAGAWVVFRETMLPSVAASRAAKETVAAAVSLANRCPYCVDVHGATLDGLTTGGDARALAAGRLGEMTDPAMRALARWARRDGGPVPFPGSGAQLPELVATAVVFAYLNRMVNVFLRDSPLPPLTGLAAGLARRGAARVMGRLARGRARPGASLGLLPGPAAAGPAWAAGQPHIAGALAGATAALETAAEPHVAAPVRAVVSGLLDGGAAGPWNGGAAGPWNGGAAAGPWNDGGAVASLPAALRPAGRLAMLTALASYRVTDAVVEEARSSGLNDAGLVRLTAWASWSAARRTGAELASVR
ncbi:carboxymuconolactone decarboxylase family protein [Catenuloplanes indicus]|uniref:AhpD family alkylhydroperoxidase n=1 Tax=Catenuloplanes indicus TaxID=137267 RepID=A0AAE4AV20_9ACTN|nr:carboxymuconolactone decarboxylase family protein [Catenuloplanes indicus]MDQ0364410.1 AhpD family alkylhydroperoxidase [Catenuloplanes indicus]